jgi:hypothetical protein
VALDAVGTVYGTDKSSVVSNAHDYLRHYEFFFADYRASRINLIEIGVLGGSSLKTWKWFFPHAQIVGIDIDERCLALREDRIDILIGSQADAAFLNLVCAHYPPTIIIDDGSHYAEHLIATFEAAFPWLAPGGLYIVEDLNCHFGAGAPRWQTAKRCDAPGYFMNLAMAVLAKGGGAQGEGPLPSFPDIDSVTTVGGSVIIRKAHAARDLPAARAAAIGFARAHTLDLRAQSRLALFILEQGGRPRRAQKLLPRHLPMNVHPEVLFIRALVDMAAGDTASAAAALAQADGMNMPEGYLRNRLAALRRKLASVPAKESAIG